MALPNEISLVCEDCGIFNFDNGVIKDGKIYCLECWYKKKIENEK